MRPPASSIETLAYSQPPITRVARSTRCSSRASASPPANRACDSSAKASTSGPEAPSAIVDTREKQLQGEMHLAVLLLSGSSLGGSRRLVWAGVPLLGP